MKYYTDYITHIMLQLSRMYRSSSWATNTY